MNYCIKLGTIFVWVLATAVAWGQKTGLTPPSDAFTDAILLEHYAQEKGLSQGTGYAIAQYDDFLWFATQDGLNRFDGYAFTVFRPGGQFGLNNSIVQALLPDSHGRFWVGTGGGLNLYDKENERFNRFSTLSGFEHTLDSVSIEKLLEDKSGNIWVMTDEKGLFCVNSSTHQIDRYFPNDNSLYGFCLDAGGALWLSIYHAIYRFDPAANTFREVINQQQLGTQSPLGSILFDGQGNGWIGTREDGVFVLKPDAALRNIIHYQHGATNHSLSSNEATALLRDRSGRIWIGSRTGGISIYNPEKRSFSHLRHSPAQTYSLAENSVWSLFEDRNGIVWIGFSSHGIDKYDPNRFSFQLIQRDNDRPLSSLPDNMIFRLFGQDETVFIGTGTGGMAQYSLTTKQVTPVLSKTNLPDRNPDPIVNNEVRVIVADRNKKLWLANSRGLVHFDPVRRTYNTYKTDGKRQQLYVYAAHLVTDSAGRTREIWTGGGAGLARFEVATKQWKNWDDLPALKAIETYTIRLMYVDPQQNLWLGTLGHGLIRYEEKTKKTVSFDDKNGLTCANIRSMLADGNTIWVGTDCGLFAIDRLTLRVKRHFSDQTNPVSFRLPNNVIYGILKDNQGFLWLSSNLGLTRFSPTQGVLKNYDLKDGLQSNEFNTNVCYRHPDGTLFFGGINGINFFKPDQLRKNTVVPSVRITNVMVLDSVYPPNQKKLTLRYNQNFIDIEFAALNYSNTEKNRYQYQLDGIDPDWVLSQHRRVAHYTNLPPGNYVFRVKGSNDDGVWNETGASLIIVIEPPFWATLWFRLGLMALLLAGLYGVYRYRITDLKSRQAHELAVSIRTQELERQRFAKELHDGVGANLAVLKLYLSSLGSPTISVDELKIRSMAVLKSSIDDIRSIIRNMHPRSLTEAGLEQTIYELVVLLNESNHLAVSFEARNVPQKLPSAVEINLLRVVQELLQNAVKHANAREVWLQLLYKTGTLTLTYRDNGRGFDPALAHQPSGNGLVNIKQRIELLKGEFSVHSAENEGTTVVISVPVAS
ncbi:ligand-binding sensor domain-containing protein [Larkinella punicea]|uniref:Histidine kinase domain-containing protein n=1 Tax=Larkinella punicea TaxID=2315727 RepID=A0A368JKK1_9BACT|nr:sensor histidine kinase [Larkinella punicea]RCR67204.1 hypothetical protein DUE52_23105 [Larkinella punicea]